MDINRIQKILRGVAGIKLILWILAIISGCMVLWGLCGICVVDILVYCLVFSNT